MYGDFFRHELLKAEGPVDPEKRLVTAYAAVFGNVDLQGERCARGCFAKTIAERVPEGNVKLYRNHETPIGVVREAVEDDFGLRVVGYISKTEAGNDALTQINDGSLNSFSFRGTSMRGGLVEVHSSQVPGVSADLGMMQIWEHHEIALKEVGPVNLLPANPKARILSVKHFEGEALDTVRELPHLIHGLTFNAGRGALNPLETRIVKSLLSLRAQLAERGDVLEALLQAPDVATLRKDAAPADESTRAGDRTPDLEISEALRTLARNRGRLL